MLQLRFKSSALTKNMLDAHIHSLPGDESAPSELRTSPPSCFTTPGSEASLSPHAGDDSDSLAFERTCASPKTLQQVAASPIFLVWDSGGCGTIIQAVDGGPGEDASLNHVVLGEVAGARDEVTVPGGDRWQNKSNGLGLQSGGLNERFLGPASATVEVCVGTVDRRDAVVGLCNRVPTFHEVNSGDLLCCLPGSVAQEKGMYTLIIPLFIA